MITDMHYGNGGYADGVKHACQALKYIDQRIKLDAVAVLGDYTDAYNAGLNPQAEADFRAVNALLDDLRFAPNLRLHGNHDFCSEWGDWASERTFRCVEAYSDDVVRGNGSYFYRDFEWHKLRIICLDTVGDSAGNVSCTAEQAQWFAEALDLSAKPDEVGWRVLVLSHHPVDFYRVEQQPGYFVEIIDAYVKGGAYNVGGVSGDFAGKGCDVDPFRFVGNIHGHIHNLLVDRICANSYDGRASIDALRIATPEACYGRNNHYDERWTEDVSYDKIQNTAKDTSFVLYCINPGSGDRSHFPASAITDK